MEEIVMQVEMLHVDELSAEDATCGYDNDAEELIQRGWVPSGPVVIIVKDGYLDSVHWHIFQPWEYKGNP